MRPQPSPAGAVFFDHSQTQDVLNLWAEVSALVFWAQAPFDQPHGAVHCSRPRFGGAVFNGPFVQLDRPFPFAAFDTLDNGVLLAAILHPTAPSNEKPRPENSIS